MRYEIETFLTGNGLIFDVGAHYGKMTKEFLKHSDKSRIVVVEPQSECMAEIMNTFGRDNERIVYVQKVLGATEGLVDFHCCNANTLSSMAWEKWSTGRFKGYEWSKIIQVPMTTLDRLIERYGVPDFIKIDVEGYELEVLKGLSHPVNALSFEIAIEFIDDAWACVDRILDIMPAEFSFGCVASPEDPWVGKGELMNRLLHRPEDEHWDDLWGDIYARRVYE